VRAEQALVQARMMVNPSAGILGVAAGKSSDHPGEGRRYPLCGRKHERCRAGDCGRRAQPW